MMSLEEVQGRSRNATNSAQRLEIIAAWTPWLIVAYFAIQLGVRLVISPNLEVDDAEMVGQIAWAWGYSHSHPPLFHWLVRICHELFGSWLAATAIPKYALLASAYLLLYDAARKASGSAVVGAVAVAFLFFVPSICWKTQGRLTHSILGLAATAAMLHALVHIVRQPKAWSFAWLGIALSAGILAKYNFLLVMGALAIAVICLPDVRRLFQRPAALLAIGLPLLLSAPHWLWLRAHGGSATENLYRLRTTGGPLGLKLPANTVWDGLVSLTVVILVSLAPMLTLYFMAKFLQRAKMEPAAAESALEHTMRRLLGVLLVSELALFVATVFIGKLSQVHERYLMVLLAPFPFWLALRWHAARQQSATLILTSAAILAVVVTAARPFSIIQGNNSLAFPYAEIAADIAPSAQTPLEVLADCAETVANIAIRLPGATVCDGQPHSARLLVIADDAATVSEFGRSLKESYEPVGEVRIIEHPRPWKPDRRISVAVQFWQLRPVASSDRS